LIGKRTKLLRQYFKYVRRGARRVEATTNNSSFDPVAFENTDRKQVVIVKATAGGTFDIRGLGSGTYGIKYSTASQYDVDAQPITINSGQALTASIPEAGVISIYGTSGK
jgi:hypothetical protein